MKATTIIAIVMMFLILFMRMENDASAFHDGGVGPCDACHSMHKASTSDSNSLLKSSDPSSTCLNCHQQTGDVLPTSYHISTPWSELSAGVAPKQLTPAGDFGWLKKNFTWNSGATGILQNSYGYRHGHNIIAADYQYLYPEDTNITAPGGTYPTASLTCISCHDPHGKYRRDASGLIATTGTPIQGSGSYASSADPQADFSVGVYRLLGGKNYQPRSLTGFGFVNDPPAAIAPNAYNRAESGTQTRVAYGSGMSEWCQNCHTTMHTIVSSGTSTIPQTHPVGNGAKLGSTVSANYNAYVKTGVLTGTVSTSFLSLVPFEEGVNSTYATLKLHAKSDGSYMSGPVSGDEQVMCLTCHRAHASGWDYATRWNANSDYVVWNGYYSQDGQAYQPYGQGRTELEAQQAYYGMKASRFALNQDTLCHKCHAGALP